MRIRFSIVEFQNEKELENLSVHTMKAYEFLFSDFLSWTEREGYERVEELTPRAIKRYFAYLKNERENNPTSLNNKRKMLITYFGFLVNEGFIDSNPAKQIKKAKEDIKIQSFSNSEVKQILSYLRRNRRKENDFHSTRNYSLVVVLLGVGIRISEAVSLQWENVHFKEGYLTVYGKSRRQEAVPMTDKVAKELGYLKSYYESKFNTLPSHVFVNTSGKPITTNAIKCFFKRLAKVMEFDSARLSGHTFRHTFARMNVESGLDVSVLSKLMRHQNLQTTSKYLNFFSNHLAEESEKHSPLKDLDI